MKVKLPESKKIEITIARFTDISSTGRLTPISDLSNRYDLDAAQVSRIIGSTLKEGLVRVSAESATRANRITRLETELRKKYTDLRSVRVIGSRAIEGPTADSDAVHRTLGFAMAGAIASDGLFRDGDYVGLGPGRGVFETVKALHSMTPLRARSVTLVSLSGLGYVTHHTGNRNLVLDSDFATALMAQAFESPVTLDLVALPLVLPLPLRIDAFDRPWILTDSRLRPALNCAVLGIGTFGPGNRFHDESWREKSSPQNIYEPIRPALQALRQLASKLGPTSSLIGDLGYHMFVIPASGGGITPTIGKELTRQVDAINSYLVSAHLEHLKSIRSLVIVAGTESKAHAIHHVLAHLGVPPVHFCTDSGTAQKLLSLT